ncbi:hypothetical protein [Pseudomonas sp.]|uniref:hypothetical protein n=1 Tax=Pseudomonas sp. TaxID=306 RepID=UPI00299F3603|nr:hypothetical protein [Pseudomonas sp.]MDX1367613.1 hypothetical protein [Pseudomonas sp.]
MSNTKWKTGFLKTGLPLEYVTSNILNGKGYSIFGEYPYLRPNENGDYKEFSIDIRAHKCLDSNERLFVLDVLLECKFRQEGTVWIFSPFPSDTMAIGLVHSTEDLVPVRLQGNALWEFEKNVGYCVSGVELMNNGGGNTDGARHGVFQLRYGMPVLLKNSYEHTLEHIWSAGRYIDFICPILVTTADLRVIKPNLQLEHFTNADELDDVSELREAVILNESPGPQLQGFADSLAEELVNSRPDLAQRLAALDEVLVGTEWENRYAPDLDTIKRSFGHSAERVLIVNYKYLDSVLSKLEGALLEDISTEKVYATIDESQKEFSLKLVGSDGDGT